MCLLNYLNNQDCFSVQAHPFFDKQKVALRRLRLAIKERAYLLRSLQFLSTLASYC